MVKSLKFSEAVREYTYEMRALGRSEHTISDYQTAYSNFLEVMGDLEMGKIERPDVVAWMHHLATTSIRPDGVAPRPERVRSKKTRLNYHTALSALWTWAVAEGYAAEHIVRQVPRPEPKAKPIEPFSTEDILKIVAACKRSVPWSNRPLTRKKKPAASRNVAIVLTLLDLCLRNSELRTIQMGHVDWDNSRVEVQGKGERVRNLEFGRQTYKYLRRWLQDRPREAGRHGDYLFCNVQRHVGHQLTRSGLNTLISRVGEAAGVADVYPHRFRHTGAIQRLQNGMNAFQLKAFLGHASLESTMRYVHIAQVDLQEAMARTSPVDNLRL